MATNSGGSFGHRRQIAQYRRCLPHLRGSFSSTLYLAHKCIFWMELCTLQPGFYHWCLGEDRSQGKRESSSCRGLWQVSQKVLVRCPTRWSLYWYLGFCDDHQHPDNRETGYSNVLRRYHLAQQLTKDRLFLPFGCLKMPVAHSYRSYWGVRLVDKEGNNILAGPGGCPTDLWILAV